ncbi:YicC/YloC family endoribonuclease [Pleionea litopenaei]|uniref:YicC/YloC family endoribonuclease n=1 Tax=Pleionea litopenaei TaxID=3070815 RepID=A0AA51RRJ9_9GAMM|nr:YicC/YloC family endoribonuclease [Pleionea sp. HL-JVS1]WMS86358.1 YicC/YloC family endoribonuclease [Pleionea sp. HL-JVS1]
MIHSMTAFARQPIKASWGNAHWEIRSVNQRFLETNFRLPEAFRSIEFQLRDRLRKRMQRGKLDISLRLEYSPTEADAISINEKLANQLIQAHKQLQAAASTEQALQITDLMRWPGLLQTTELDTSRVEKDLLAAFDEAIDALLSMRQREGDALIDIIQARLDGIAEQVIVVRGCMDDIIQWQRDRITNRFTEAKIELDPERLEQEMVMLAQKVDVEEELDRLDTHIQEVSRLLKKGGTIGRRLDFLMQELNREANTLGSKSISSKTTAASVEIKVLIEQMREQIQNIE